MSQHVHFSQQDQFPYSIGELAPGSPDSISMPGLSRPADGGMRPFMQYASLPAESLGAGHPMGDLLSFAGSHDAQHTFVQNPGGLVISQFIQDRGPWNPLGIGPVSADPTKGQQPATASFNPTFSIDDYRSPHPPSEADTVSQSVAGILSDSGYGSMARQSVGNPSVYGGDLDQSFETQSFISRFQMMGQDSMSSKEELRKREVRGQRHTNARTLICPDCNAAIKTNSELKKHQARHKKPFKCHVSGCLKAIEGFSTNNDLDRHKRCVHKLRVGDETVYRCDLGPCKDKPKDWPRQDNFKQHLKRRHNVEPADLTRFTFRSSSSADVAGVGQPGTVAPEEMAMTNANPATDASWPQLDHTHISPAVLMNGNPMYHQTGNMMSYHQSNTEPAIAGFGIPRSSHQGASVPAARQFSAINQPVCVAPDVLSHASVEIKSFAPQNTHVPAPEVVEIEDDESEDDAGPEQEEVESHAPEDMDVDDPVQDSTFDAGLQDMESVDNEPSDDTRDRQVDALQDAAAGQPSEDDVHIKISSPPEEKLGPDTPQPVDVDDESQARAVLQSLISKGKLGNFLKEIGYQLPEAAENKDEKPPVDSSAASDSGRLNKCDECPKTFNRRCELKKHQKRHEKPYACTFAKCSRKFGSKNDWKRHENSQHVQLEIWRCTETTSITTTITTPGDHQQKQQQPQPQECGKVYHRLESLKAHLEKAHAVRDPAVLDRKLADCRMGRNFESRFWCGFCQKTIEPTNSGGPAHSERFDHIDDHFSGKGGLPKADIKDWKHIETDPVDASPENSPGKGRQAGWGGAGTLAGRKRAYREVGESGPAKAKRIKGGSGSGGKVFLWTCCFCGNYWRKHTTPKCMSGNGCDHAYCDDCVVDEIYPESEPEPEPELVQAQGEGQDGI